MLRLQKKVDELVEHLMVLDLRNPVAAEGPAPCAPAGAIHQLHGAADRLNWSFTPQKPTPGSAVAVLAQGSWAPDGAGAVCVCVAAIGARSLMISSVARQGSSAAWSSRRYRPAPASV
jgi:hypothetical protein